MIDRKKTKEIKIGNRAIGNDNPIAIQSMTNTKTENTRETIKQILELEKAGCDIIRSTVPTIEAAKALKNIKNEIHIPIIADIHFDYKLAIAAIENGADKIRINPGNIGDESKIQAVIDAAKEYNIPIRIGVNGGSLEKEICEKFGGVTADALAMSALKNIELIEKMGFENIVVSIKSSDVLKTIEAHKIFSEKSNYPLHVGITEAGTINTGTIKSAVGIGAILASGIGDTIRVSLSGNPINEVIVAKKILSSLCLRDKEAEVISCPTCGRTNIDVESLANEVEKRLIGLKKPIKVAVMGCVVNGPGEAKDADIGICGGKGEGLIIKKGEIVKKVKESKLIDELFKEIETLSLLN